MTVALLRRLKLGRTSCREIAAKSQHNLSVVLNDRDPFPPDLHMVIRWGCTGNVPTRNVVNSAEAIHRVGDKSGFRRLLMQEAPHTIPTTVFAIDGPIAYPLVVRPRTHAQGRQLWVVSNFNELRAATQQAGEGWYASELINKVAEYRIAFVQGRVAWVANKTPGNPEDVAWNVARGGRFDNVRWDEWPLRAIKIAREAFMLSGLDFGGVDVMVDTEGKPYVLEINSAPSLTSPYRQECMAKCFDYIINNGKETIPIIEARGGWRKFIHPAISEEAQLV